MVRIGVLGIGFMGVTHFKAIQQIDGASVAAICTRDPKKLAGDWSGIQGNFGDSGGVQDLSGIRTYNDIGAFLADDDIDLVDICLPTHMHREATEQAFASRRHVLVEKPIALKVEDANAMLAAADNTGRLLLVAHVLRFFPEFLALKQLVEQAPYGPVQTAHFKRMISRPKWLSPDVQKRSGGPAIDLHIHDVDFIRYVFGEPTRLQSHGVMGDEGLVHYVHTLYDFGNDGPAVSAEGGWLAPGGLPFEHGYDVYFEQAVLKYNSTTGAPPTLISADGETQPPVPTADGFVGELAEAVQAVNEGRQSAIISGASARDSLELCLREINELRK